MKIFSSHRKKLEPRRRFGGREFRTKVKEAASYKRMFNSGSRGWFSTFLSRIGLSSKLWRWGLSICLILVVYYLCISTRFVVTQISVSGNSQISSQQISDAIASAGRSRFFLMKGNNFFLMSQGHINKILTTALPSIKEVTKYQRIWPNQVRIEIRERVPGFVIQSSGKFFLIDEDGGVVSQINDPKGFLVVHDQLTEDFGSGEILPNAKLAPFVLSITKQWSGKVSTPVVSIKFPGKKSTEVQFVTREGWVAFFDINRAVVAQLNSLAVLLNKQIPLKDHPNLAYIDLRLERRAYYCLKASACAQSPAEAGTNTSNETPATK